MKQISKTIFVSAVAGMAFATAGAQMLPDSAEVNVAFRSVKQSELMGGVSAVDMESLIEKDYTDYSLTNMEDFIGGYNGEIWGMGEALVLVDGVPRDANNILPTEIATITFLKSAQAVVLYGSRGAKGVILITTKRGNTEGLQVSVRGNATLNVPKRYPNYLESAEYMTLYNEALANDGLNPVFSQEDIYHYASGENPYRYPNTDFFSNDYIKKNYMKYEGVAEFRGGGKFAQFYANVGLYNVEDLMNFGEGKKNHTTRLNVRGNIDLRLNDWITGWVNTSATFYDARGDRSDFWAQSSRLRPTNPGSAPLVPLIPIDYIGDGDAAYTYINNSPYVIGGKYLLGGTQLYQTNPFAAMYAAGWSKFTSRQLQFDAGIKLDLSRITEGLGFRIMYGVDYSNTYNTSIANDYRTYEATWDNALGKDMITALTPYNLDKRNATQNISGSSERQIMAFNAYFDYKRTFAEKHNLYAMLLANGYQQTNSGSYHRVSNTNLGLTATYNYDQRYYVEFSGAEVYSTKLPDGNRTAFSPTASAAWRISQESFIKDNPSMNWINELKLSAGYSVINQDLDIENYYMYQDIFTATGAWWGWSEVNNAMQTTDYRRGGNKDLTFVKRKEVTVSLQGAFFDNTLNLQADFFQSHKDGQLCIPSTVFPSYFQTYWPESDMRPYINYNNTRYTGFDWGINYFKDFGNDVSFGMGFNGMYVTSKNTRWDENVEYDWLRTEGALGSAMRGYECLGFFQSEEEIANSAVINKNTKPGDLKYKDQNGDGVIDGKDNVVIGNWASPWTLGVNLSIGYKGFTLFAAGHARIGGNGLKSNDGAWVYGDRKYTSIVRGRWTPKTADKATYPRLTTQGGELNFVTSDFWMYSTDAFFVDKIQLTYDFPQRWFDHKFVKGLQLYVYGANLCGFYREERKYQETNIGSAPQCRNYNFGVKVDF